MTNEKLYEVMLQMQYLISGLQKDNSDLREEIEYQLSEIEILKDDLSAGKKAVRELRSRIEKLEGIK